MPKSSTQNINDKNLDSKLPEIFKGLEPNVHLLHLAVLRQLNNKRAGTASTKTKAEVRGGGKKPWKQKGTGRARAGSIRSPLWVGGGITFGPKPRSYKSSLPKKARNIAIAQAFSTKAKDIVQVKKLPELKAIKTKDFLKEVKSVGNIKIPVLYIADLKEPGFKNAQLASGNLKEVILIDQQFVGAYDLLKAGTVIITETAIKQLEDRLSRVVKKRGK